MGISFQAFKKLWMESALDGDVTTRLNAVLFLKDIVSIKERKKIEIVSQR